MRSTHSDHDVLSHTQMPFITYENIWWKWKTNKQTKISSHLNETNHRCDWTDHRQQGTQLWAPLYLCTVVLMRGSHLWPGFRPSPPLPPEISSMLLRNNNPAPSAANTHSEGSVNILNQPGTIQNGRGEGNSLQKSDGCSGPEKAVDVHCGEKIKNSDFL